MVDLPENVPETVRLVFSNLGDLKAPDDAGPEVQALYDLGNAGKCMMCEAPLDDETVVKVTVTGVNQVYCSHKCDQDMQLLGYLAEQYDDVKERVRFRGAAAGADGPF